MIHALVICDLCGAQLIIRTPLVESMLATALANAGWAQDVAGFGQICDKHNRPALAEHQSRP